MIIKTLNTPTHSIFSIVGLVALSAFIYLLAMEYIISGLHEIIDLKTEKTTLRHIGLMCVPTTTFILIVSSVCLAVNIFKPLKAYSDEGLFFGLATGITAGLVLGLYGGLFFGVFTGLLVTGLLGLTAGLTVGLTAGLILGLVFELS